MFYLLLNVYLALWQVLCMYMYRDWFSICTDFMEGWRNYNYNYKRMSFNVKSSVFAYCCPLWWISAENSGVSAVRTAIFVVSLTCTYNYNVPSNYVGHPQVITISKLKRNDIYNAELLSLGLALFLCSVNSRLWFYCGLLFAFRGRCILAPVFSDATCFDWMYA